VEDNRRIPPTFVDPLLAQEEFKGPRFDPPTVGETPVTYDRRPSLSGRRRRGALDVLASPESRLLFSVSAVLVATVVLGTAGRDDQPAVTLSTVTAPAAGVPAPVPSDRRVLVSDPANTAIVREIAGNLLTVESIIPPGANGHTYEPVPGDAIKAASADLFIENGLDLNPSVTRFVAANARNGMQEIKLADAVPEAEVISTDSAAEIASHGHAHAFNAHLWTDPVYAIAYAEKIKVALSSLDPPNAAIYSERAAKFINRLRVLDATFRAAIDSIPSANRKLVVYHDSWAYFGRRYGIPVIGAIQPVTFSEPSADEVRRMIDQIRREAVPAFFGSEVFPSEVLATVAAETGANYHADLSDEELPGAPGTPEHSYEGMMIANVRLITSALGGNSALLDNLRPGVSPS
jgi:ABC-type Zn uptake system ZnuABC Zn-binding protein ZnuA